MKMNPQEEQDAGPDRRDFLQAGLVGAGAVLAAPLLAAAPEPLELSDVGPDKIPRKPFGKTNEHLSVIGLGGFSIGSAPSYKEAEQIVHDAVDAGVNFCDNAWEYHDGRSEEWMGRALKGRRDKVFLMTKVCTHGRDKKVAMTQLEESLKRRSEEAGQGALRRLHRPQAPGPPQEDVGARLSFRLRADAAQLLRRLLPQF
jgi:hypothetical protein